MDAALAKRICDRLDSDPELQALAIADDTAAPTETAAVAGVSYRLGAKPVRPLAAVHFAALAMIDSPILSRDRDITPIDAWRALHVIRYAPDCLEPVMGLQQRIATLRALETIARDNKAVASVLLARLDDVARTAWQEFDRDVMERTAAEYNGASADEIDELIVTMLRDVRTAWEQLPRQAAGDAPQSGAWDADWLASVMETARSVGCPDPASAVVTVPLAQLWDRAAARLRSCGDDRVERSGANDDAWRARRDAIIAEEVARAQD